MMRRTCFRIEHGRSLQPSNRVRLAGRFRPLLQWGRDFSQGLGRILQVYSEFSTTIHDLIVEDDRVACRLSHRAVNRGEWTSRLGRHDVAGKPVSWPAIAIFRFRDGKIAEEWVSRDELGMLIDLGVLAPFGSSV